MKQTGLFGEDPAPAPRKTRTETIERDALISPCGLYRYWLMRRWDRDLPMGMVNMLNPSDGDAKIDDNTIVSLIKRARIWGWGGYYIGNLFGFRSPHPEDLLGAKDPIGPETDKWLAEILLKVLGSNGKVVVAWGSWGQLSDPHGRPGIVGRDTAVLRMLTKQTEVLCLARGQGGAPTHPLARGKHRIPDDAPLEVFRPKDGEVYVKPKREPPRSVHDVPPKSMPPLGSAPTGPCSFCGIPTEGRYGCPASPNAIKRIVPICNRCGPGFSPTLPEIWAKMAEQVEVDE